MAELLIRVVDKVNPDFYLNTKCTKRGDVIVVCPDGWPWGTEERNRPDYRIVAVPQMSVEEASALCAPELDVDPAHPSRTLQRRAFRWNVDDPSVHAMLADASRAQPIVSFAVLPLAQLRALKKRKSPIPDPAVIGVAPSEIG